MPTLAAPATPPPIAALKGASARAAALLRSLGNPDRLLLMCELAQGERSVGALAQATGVLQPSLSQQLGVLRDEGLVATRREGKFVHYRVASAPALELLQLLHRLYCEPPPARGDRAARRLPETARAPETIR